MSKKKSGVFGETLRTVVYAVLIALGIRIFAYEPFNIPSGSMIPTLLIGDYLFVSKFSYGYSRYSLPLGFPLFEGRILSDEPERGDVVVFKLPKDNSTDYIKRIVGLPGDEIQVVEGILHINGVAVKRELVGEVSAMRGGGYGSKLKEYNETLPNGVQHPIWEVSDNGSLDNTPVYAVPAGHYFAMGDNRDQSKDSRFLDDVGYIPAQNLIGRAEFLFFSIDGPVWEIWNWFTTVRAERLFTAIE